MSRREQILDALVAALGAAGKPTGVTVTRFRTLPFMPDQMPAMIAYCVGETSQRGDGPFGYKTRRSLTVRVECRVAVASDTDTPADAALDPLVTWVVQAAMADPRQGGLAMNTQDTAVGWDTVEVEGYTLCAAGVDLTIDYATAAGDPDAP